MVKVKVEKKMNLPELIQYIWDNNIIDKRFISNSEYPLFVLVNSNSDITIVNDEAVKESEMFILEVEEELTENTVLPSVVVVRTQYFPNNGHSVNVAKINYKSIKQVIENQPNNSKFEYHSIYLMESERIGQLIWKDGELVGDE
ncbi:hypothetical protein [Staphylococcus hominis]|jgi:hypothetical protein|uniref:hypothetical protein n=1 Tax=Staphylococcus hominis TaxID=1290 RepID=UPI0011A92611|nr:hypothetical protein [Staphylococcus hominis]